MAACQYGAAELCALWGEPQIHRLGLLLVMGAGCTHPGIISQPSLPSHWQMDTM